MEALWDRIAFGVWTLLAGPSRRPRLVPIPVAVRSSRHPWAFVCLLLPAFAGEALAQGRIRDFTEPVLRHNSEGHHAAVQALIFPRPDGSVLLSGGLDKVVHQWNLDGEDLAPTRTIRPPLWRGKRGEIRAMALSSRVDAQGQRILAVGGTGIAYNSGDVVLFRYPGLDLVAQATGDLVAHLPTATVEAPDAGHRDAILRLAFNPRGDRLATAGFDGTVRIWDVDRRTTVANLVGHSGAVAGLAWLGDDRVATGDGAGDVRIWEINPAVREAARVRITLDDVPLADRESVVALAATADGGTLVVGDARGRVTRFEAPALANPVRIARKPNQGAVVALALSADGTRLGVSYERLVVVAPGVQRDWGIRESDVEVRSALDGSAILPTITVPEYATAVAFSPDNRRFLYAGGPSQAIHVRSINPVVPDEAPRTYQGHGSTIREIGFAPEGLGLAISRERLANLNPAPEEFEGFDLEDRRPRTYPAAGIRRAETSLGGWRVEPVSISQVDVVHQNGFRVSATLNRRTDGDWWCHSLLAPRNAGEHPLLAVGCTAGVAIYTLSPEFKRVRFLAGHEGEVLSLAASADGKWLATAGADQTARLWSLADAEKLPPFGATLRRDDDGAHRFATVEPGGFADAMGIGPGDQFLEALIDGRKVEPDAFVAGADAAVPGPDRNISIRILKPGQAPAAERTVALSTSKRQSPALGLFLADRPAGEWVMWTPSGLYDTSIGGDGKYLGWHLNQSSDIARPRPTAYHRIARFSDRLRRPEALRLLLSTGDERAFAAEAVRLAVAEPAVIVAGERPPQLGALVASVAGNVARVRVKATALGGKLLARLNVSEGVRPVQTVNIPANQNAVDAEYEIPIDPGAGRIGVTATDADGKAETAWIDVRGQAPPPRPARLVVLTFGSERFGSAPLPPVAHAERDAAALAGFLADRLLAPGTESPHDKASVERRALTGGDATSAGLAKEIDALRGAVKKGELRSGDQVAVAVETQLLVADKEPLLAGADLVDLVPVRPSKPMSGLAENLGELTAAGVRTTLFLDVVHKDFSAAEGQALASLVKDLRDRRGVIVLVASGVRRPSEPRVVEGRLNYPNLRERVFARSILDVASASAGRRVRVDKDGRMSLDGFQLTVNEAARSLTRGKQLTGCYVPDSVSPNAKLLAIGSGGR